MCFWEVFRVISDRILPQKIVFDNIMPSPDEHSKCNSLFTCIIYRDAKEQAEKIALEIESQPAYKERTDVENGDENEEAKYAAVERPGAISPDEIKAGKYVAPGRRKQHNTQAGKLIRPTQLVNNNIGGSPSTSSVQVVSHQNSNNKYSALVSHSLPLQQSVQKTSGKISFI